MRNDQRIHLIILSCILLTHVFSLFLLVQKSRFSVDSVGAAKKMKRTHSFLLVSAEVLLASSILNVSKIGSKRKGTSKTMVRTSHRTTGKSLSAKFVNRATLIFSKGGTIFSS